MVYPALLPLMHTPRLPVVDWTDALRADLNGLVRFARKTKSGFCACAITFQTQSTLLPPGAHVFNIRTLPNSHRITIFQFSLVIGNTPPAKLHFTHAKWKVYNIKMLSIHQLMHQWVALKNNITIYIETAPTCFGVTVTPSSVYCRTVQHTDTNKDPIYAATPPPY